MRLSIRHETTYTYAKPARRAIEVLRLTPRGHNGQFVVSWRIDVDKDCRLQRSMDPFGNTLNSFTAEGPLSGLVIVAAGSIETQDTSGVLRGQIERFQPQVFLRETRLTMADPAIRDFAESVRSNAGPDPLAVMHALMDGIGDRLVYDQNVTGAGTGSVEAFTTGHGVCQDFAHVFIAAARHLAVPARYVSGYLYRQDGQNQQKAGHAWAEALIEGLGWVGFDPANRMSPTDAYVRLAVGLDYLGAAPVRGSHYGGEGETLTVSVSVSDAGLETRGRNGQSQRQSQSQS
jgi:transglutaminase-like putative cysteine protease